jgi:hypothetical protein
MSWNNAVGAASTDAFLSRNRRQASVGSTVMMWFLLALGDLVLATKGFAGIYRFVEQWPVRRGRKRVSDEAVIGETRLALASAAVWYVKRVKCLQSAFATTCYLRWRGLPTDMVVGVQKMPFRAHAWAEYAGSPVDEKPAVVAQYKTITRCVALHA